MHLSDARDSWLPALRAEGASPNTLEIYHSAIERFIEFLRDKRRPVDVAKITRDDVLGFLTHLQETRAQATARNRYRALRAFFHRPWCMPSYRTKLP
jgi:site-specific recombinase XerD